MYNRQTVDTLALMSKSGVVGDVEVVSVVIVTQERFFIMGRQDLDHRRATLLPCMRHDSFQCFSSPSHGERSTSRSFQLSCRKAIQCFCKQGGALQRQEQAPRR